jgi:hypothetical protein
MPLMLGDPYSVGSGKCKGENNFIVNAQCAASNLYSDGMHRGDFLPPSNFPKHPQVFTPNDCSLEHGEKAEEV